ncbi:DUF6058 family natural product biosynthesis protein [Shewanella sp. SR44-3]|uniref:DUF6058 family natural product biosynthesis protein n=1 Tax=unclassified Shewanella TaxID=196818 RepID=UPI0015FC0A3F|nr:DUF6058 family natural product biosynthesis protein [Shewanella sp. SR44-3]MBB1269900.1 hypothetical protein [Shewanella sp. SR44-3]
MELMNYLNEHFFTQQQLLDISKVSQQDLLSYQQQGLMPKCSYQLRLQLQSDSFFGLHHEEQTIEYYAKGYAAWLGLIQVSSSVSAVFEVFATRYKMALEDLKRQGHSTSNAKVNAEFDAHIKQEWAHFLNGIYGLCTRSGLPEDIAAKELAILEINELLDVDELTQAQLSQLRLAVNLLDKASSMFAPHERLNSSRQRLINEVRYQYQLAI